MRLLEQTQQEAIMKKVRQGIQSHFQFHFPDSNLEIISGTQEGIYQWLAINYVLNRFDQVRNFFHCKFIKVSIFKLRQMHFNFSRMKFT